MGYKSERCMVVVMVAKVVDEKASLLAQKRVIQLVLKMEANMGTK